MAIRIWEGRRHGLLSARSRACNWRVGSKEYRKYKMLGLLVNVRGVAVVGWKGDEVWPVCLASAPAEKVPK